MKSNLRRRWLATPLAVAGLTTTAAQETADVAFTHNKTSRKMLIKFTMTKKCIFLTFLMAVVGVTTAYADESDMGTWRENNNFGQNGADMTADGYSKWDGVKK
jgi:hypothetical protein